ncbi:YDG/SRA domain-containing protein [Colletotrichum asianum]|uniref:YDG/SRA domain-containing protein n=1 Tax=Colletotrichum asianum TaxID=702518 RepID=A0A8H3WDT1_9PEZI|nr:YDG/SRA domain-containing protein [Colletotrichum asianum]
MSYDVPYEDQNSLCEQGHHGYASHDGDEVGMSMDFHMADNTEVADAHNAFVRQEDQQAYHSHDTVLQDDRMIEGTSTNDEQTQSGGHADIIVDPAVEAAIVNGFHRLAAEILFASKKNKGPPVQETHDELHRHLSFIECRANFLVGVVRRHLMDTVLVMFDKGSTEYHKYIDAYAQARAFALWQLWAQLNKDQLDEASFAALDDNDRKYCAVFTKETLMRGVIFMPGTQACFKAPDAEMSIGDHDAMALQEAAAYQDASKYPTEVDDGMQYLHYPQGLANGENFYHMSMHAYGEVPTCIRDPLDTEDDVKKETSGDLSVPVAIQTQQNTQAAAKPRRKTAKAATVESDSNSNPADGLYVPDKNDPTFGKGAPCQGIAYAIKNGKKSWVSNPDYSAERVNSRIFGSNDIPVGKWWPSQSVACFNGAHGSWCGGIVGDKNKGAYSILKSGGSYSSVDEDQGDVLFYSGSGAHNCEGDKPKNSDGTEMLYKSLKKRLPVRVLRAAPKKAGDGLYSPSVGIRYDGLYDVVRRTKAFNDNGGAY